MQTLADRRSRVALLGNGACSLMGQRALASIGAVARSAWCPARRCAKTSRRSSLGRARRPPPTTRSLSGLRQSSAGTSRRHSCAWVRPCAVLGVQAGFPGGILVQGQGYMPFVQHAPHGRDRSSPGRHVSPQVPVHRKESAYASASNSNTGDKHARRVRISCLLTKYR